MVIEGSTEERVVETKVDQDCNEVSRVNISAIEEDREIADCNEVIQARMWARRVYMSVS